MSKKTSFNGDENSAASSEAHPHGTVTALIGGARSRRDMLSLLGLSTGFFGVSMLAGCGGGSGSNGSTSAAGAASSSSSSSSSTTSSSASSSASSSSSATTGTNYAGAANPWPWNGAGTSTTATVPVISDFVTVVASGTVDYNFHTATTSSTTDPVTGAVSDTTTSATLVPYLMSKYLVTNANWKAFCNAMGSSYYPTTSRTAGRYWADGAYPADKEDHPVFFISLTHAQAFCAWLGTQIPGYSFYVPTEGEWEYAALGTNTSYNFPWGTDTQTTYNSNTGVLDTLYYCTQFVLNSSGLTTLSYYYDSVVTTLNDGSTALTNDTAPLRSVLTMNASGGVTGWQYDSTANSTWADFANSDQFGELVQLYGGYSTPVGTFPGGRSWSGLFDMAGNAYEWTSTLNLASNGAESGTSVNVVKGGSWYATSNSGRSTGRGEGRSASGGYHSVGFRVAARPQ